MTAATAAGVTLGSLASRTSIAATSNQVVETVWQDGMQINPRIDNLRVTFCHDPDMVSSNPLNWNMRTQNEVVDGERVSENMDKMAAALAGTADYAEAWAAVFQKPAGKDWADVNVAVKVNSLDDRNVPRLAIVAKVCEELHNLGVPYGSMTVYDGGGKTDDANHIWQYADEFSRTILPQGVRVSKNLGGEVVEVALPDSTEVFCLSPLLDDTVDLLVNIAVNKGHDIPELGSFTLTMKNHVGSIFINDHPSPDQLFEMNKINVILGRGSPPRQQLCIVDSLWGLRAGPYGVPDSDTKCLVMGTFSPAVDYLTVKKIREAPEFMGIDDTNREMLDRFMTEFGYDINSDEIQDLDLVDALSYEPPVYTEDRRPVSGDEIIVSMTVPARPSRIRFSIPGNNLHGLRMGIYDLRGRIVRSLGLPQRGGRHAPVTFDGMDKTGSTLSPGEYIVKVDTGKSVKSRSFVLLPG
jgi:hypothetical protein